MPNNLEVLHSLADILSDLNDYPPLEATYNKILSLDTDSQAAILLKRANARFKQENYKGAFDDLQLMLERDPGDSNALQAYVDYYLALTDHQLILSYATTAKQACNQLIASVSDDEATTYKLKHYKLKQIKICNLTQDYQGIIELTESLLAVDPDHAAARYWQSIAYFKLEKYGDAIAAQRQLDKDYAYKLRDFYTTLLNKTEMHYEALYLRAELYARNGEFSKAIRDCDRLFTGDPIDKAPLWLKLNCLRHASIDDYDYHTITTVCQTLLKFIHNDKKLLEAITRLGGRIGYDLAAQVYALLRQLEPENDDYLKASLPARLGSGNYQNILTDCNTLLGKTPDDKETRLWRARFWFSQKDYKNALSDCETILRVQPSHTEAEVWRTKCLLAMNRYAHEAQHINSFEENIKRLLDEGCYQDVLSDCDFLLQIERDNLTALRCKAYSEFSLAKYEEAEQTYLQLLNAQNDEDYPRELFLAQLKLGKYQEIIDSCNKILNVDECNEVALLYRAKAWLAQGNHEKVDSDCRELLRISYDDEYKRTALLTLVESLLKRGDLQAIVKLLINDNYYYHVDELLSYCNERLIQQPNDVSILWLRIKLMLLQLLSIPQSDNAERILADYAKLSTLRPNDKDVLELRLECADLGDAKEVLAICDSLLSDEPNHLKALQTKVKLEFELKNYPTVVTLSQQIMELAKAMENQPNKDTVYLINLLFAESHYTAAQFHLGKYQTVLEACQRGNTYVNELISINHKLAPAMQRKGDSYWENTKIFNSYKTKALVKLEKWEEALACQKSSDLTEMYDYYTELLTTQPDHDKLLWLRANIAIQAKNVPIYLEAIKDCDKLCEMQNDEAKLLGLETKIELYQLYGVPLEPLEPLYQRVLTLSPHHKACLWYLARDYYKQRKYQQAISHCENILSHGKEGFFEASKLLAEIYYSQRLYANEAQVWQRLIQDLGKEITHAQRLEIAKISYTRANYALTLEQCEHILQNVPNDTDKEAANRLRSHTLFLQGRYEISSDPSSYSKDTPLLNIIKLSEPKNYFSPRPDKIVEKMSELFKLMDTEINMDFYRPLLSFRMHYGQIVESAQIIARYQADKQTYSALLDEDPETEKYTRLGLALVCLRLGHYTEAQAHFQQLQEKSLVEPWVTVGGLLLCDYYQNPTKLSELQADMLNVWNRFTHTLKQGDTNNEFIELFTSMTLKLFIIHELLPLISKNLPYIDFNFAASNRLLPEQVWNLSRVINKHQIKCINHHTFKLQDYWNHHFKLQLFNKINGDYSDIRIDTQDTPRYSP